MTASVGENAKDVAAPMSGALLRWKLRLQFSGWLQFTLPFLIALPFALIAALCALLGWLQGAWVFGVVVGIILLWALFDIVVVKLRLVTLPDRTARPVTGDAFAVMAARRACRSFQQVDLTPDDRTALDHLLAKHTGYDCAYSLAQGVVRAEYVAAPLTVWPAVGAREFLVVLGPAAYDRVAVIEAGRALQHVVNGLTAQGIATCWIGPGADRGSVEAALGPRFDPAQDHVLCVIALGYRSRYVPLTLRLMRLATRRRKPLADLVFEGAPGLAAPLHRAPYKSLRPVLAACRAAPSSYNSQTCRIMLHSAEGQLAKVAFCSQEGSRFYAPLATGIWAANWEEGMAALGRSGTLSARKTPTSLAGALVHDLDWIPNRTPEV